MRKSLLVLVFFLWAPAVLAQGFRFEGSVTQAVALTNVNPLVVTVPSNPVVRFCMFPANAVPCTNLALTYTSVTLGTACSGATQFILAGTTVCVAAPDINGNWGVWAAQGTYSYTVSIGTSNYGPFTVTLGVPGTASGPATSVVNDIAAFNNTTGSLLKDSGILTGNLFLINTNNAATGNNTFAGTTGLNGGGALSGTFTGNPTLSGNPLFTGNTSFSQQITSTLASGTAPFSIASTTVVPNLNVATLAGVSPSNVPSGAGQVCQSTSSTACAWATLPPPQYPLTVYNTAPAPQTGSISATTMATAGVPGNTYRFSFYVDITAVGTTCGADTPTFAVKLIWTEPAQSVVKTMTIGTLTLAGNGQVGTSSAQPNAGDTWAFTGNQYAPATVVRAKGSTNVQYSVTYTDAGGLCTIQPTYQIFPILEQLTAN